MIAINAITGREDLETAQKIITAKWLIHIAELYTTVSLNVSIFLWYRPKIAGGILPALLDFTYFSVAK